MAVTQECPPYGGRAGSTRLWAPDLARPLPHGVTVGRSFSSLSFRRLPYKWPGLLGVPLGHPGTPCPCAVMFPPTQGASLCLPVLISLRRVLLPHVTDEETEACRADLPKAAGSWLKPRMGCANSWLQMIRETWHRRHQPQGCRVSSESEDLTLIRKLHPASDPQCPAFTCGAQALGINKGETQTAN